MEQDSPVRLEITGSRAMADQLRQDALRDFPARFIEKRHLTGEPAVWIAAATVSLKALSMILNHIERMAEIQKVIVRVGDVEIVNPSPEDMQAFRPPLKKRIANDP